MRIILPIFLFCLMVIPILSVQNVVFAEEQTKEKKQSAPSLTPAEVNQLLVEKFKKGKYSKKGADSCLKCHDAESTKSAMGIFDNIHGRLDVKNSPFVQLQCESCHGPSGKHDKKVRKGKVREPMITFGINSPVEADKQNSVCLSCHEDRPRIAWQNSAHQSEQVPCATCHQVHKGKDPIFVKQQQNEVCGACHQEQEHATNKRSSHPLKWGEMACSDCHNPHGSFSDHELTRPTINETCFNCHAEKRGPKLWEHAPVAEDCSICHSVHGSINANLLKQRTPQLCQDCHTPADHPSTVGAGEMFKNNAQNAFVVGQNCQNCHSLVHGSNHPSGQMFKR